MWDLVLLGLVITLEPVPLAGFILLLSTTDGTKKGLAYITGWVACLVVTVVGTLAVTGGHAPRAHSLPGRGVSAAAVLAVLLQPWPLVIAGVALVAEADVSSVASVVSLVLFCLLSTASILAMEGYMVFDHARATARLAALREWLNRNRDPVLAVLALCAGVLLMAKGVYQLAQ